MLLATIDVRMKGSPQQEALRLSLIVAVDIWLDTP